MKLSDRELDLSAADGARALVRGLLDEADEAARALAANAGDEPLHDFRVALRRLRSALRALRPWLGRVRKRHVRKLKRLARATAAARDAEVQLTFVETRRDALGAPRLRAGVALLVARLEARAAGTPDPAQLSRRYERAAMRISRRLGASGRAGGRRDADRLDVVLAGLLEAQTAALRQRMGAISGPADEARVHRARIEGKRLRYLLEPLRDGRADPRGAIERLKRLQDVLGELHDAHVLAAELREGLVEAAAERAVKVHAAVYAAGGSAGVRGALMTPSPRPGLLALLRLVRERRDVLHAELERTWRGAGLDALERELRTVTAALLHDEERGSPATEHPRRTRRSRRTARAHRPRGRSASASSISSSSFTPTVPPKPLKGRIPNAD